MLPLRSVRLAVHSASQRILSLKTVTKKVYYLQLCQEHPDAVFRLWTRLVDILQSGLSITSKDSSIRIRHSLVSSGSSPSSGSSVEVVRTPASGKARSLFSLGCLRSDQSMVVVVVVGLTYVPVASWLS